MDQTTRILEVIYSGTARKEILGIWKYNSKEYGSAEHATLYVDFLFDCMESLATKYSDAKRVETNGKLRYITMKRSRSGSGHVAVFRVTRTAIRV